MKKVWFLLLAVVFATVLVACGNSEDTSSADETNNATNENDVTEEANTEIDKLSVGFVPSRDPEEIITATEPLKALLQEELAGLGFDVGEVDITVGTNYEAVGEALSAGTTDIGLIPGGTYVLYDDGAEVLLTSTRAGLSIDSEDPADWNDNKPTEPTEEQVTYYRSLIIAGPSAKGQELAEKVNNGEELTFEDLNSASWAVMTSSSSAGYIYPTLWLQDNYGQKITDLDNLVQVDSYGSAFARLAAEQVDILVSYADARRDNEEAWQGEFERKNSIWDETNVVGVTAGIYNDTISASKNSEKMTDELKAAVQQAFINIAETDEGKEVISIYSHEGYQEAQDSDYDKERDAQVILQEAN
ncbi:PhnD/SsuA/transferrin family substrate-binding protein [Amphibacillus sediminis]|uniref:PhnD/SsuA/transferrin family substrate-binding protein n=1 Tax=Amphibacillus sediminis TaxID=360185 RepID=UPI000835645D|nr:PhnD/SsuA/transferrin family substrate-binding protein [Amphibacillus sediminis]